MLGQARIDGLKFAREGRSLRGEVAVADLPRLEDVVLERSGVVSFALNGSTNAQGKGVLDIEIEVKLALECQRCLARLDYELRRKSRLLLTESGQTLPDVGDEDPNAESIPAEEVSDVADIVEQEVLLGLPIAPMHAPGACETRVEPSRDATQSPFAALSKLKKS